ncbi:MAG: DUF1236 domain-containing protein [Hyphomicrobium sp.]
MRKGMFGTVGLAALALGGALVLGATHGAVAQGIRDKGAEAHDKGADAHGERSDAPNAANKGLERSSQAEGARGVTPDRSRDESGRGAAARSNKDEGGRAAHGSGTERGSKPAQDGSRGDRTGKTGDADQSSADRETAGKLPEGKSVEGRTTPDRSDDQAGHQQGDRKVDEVKQKVTSRDRDKAREAFGNADLRKATNVKVRVSAGVRLPRHVALYALPPDIIAVVPAYRGYDYVAIDNEICIVDPETYVIVDVIHRGERYVAATGRSGGEAGSSRLTLTADEERFIREHVARDRKADIAVRLSIGTDIPSSVELIPFPAPVLSEVPKVRDYRYIVTDDGVAIVDPGEKDVVYMIPG